MASQEAVARYRIDSRMSRFTVKAFASGLFSVMGHDPTIAIRDYDGEAGFVPGTLDQAFVRITARPDSLEVTDDIAEKDKLEIDSEMKQHVLETSRYSEISFESLTISPTRMGDNRYVVNVTGNLKLHGVTRTHTIIAQVVLNSETFRAFGELSLRQTDHGIKLVSVAGGTLKVKDELKLSIDIVARNQA